MAPPRTKPASKLTKVELTAEHLKTIVHYDSDTGIFTRIKKTCNRVKLGQHCGALNTNGYLQISIESRLYLASNLAVLYMTGEWPANMVDHKNTIRTDNRWSNLRDVPSSINVQNKRSPSRNSKSGFLGVSPLHGKWAANISTDKKRTHLGSFATPEQASAAYITAKRIMHPGNTL